jgi:hypothetical protein
MTPKFKNPIKNNIISREIVFIGTYRKKLEFLLDRKCRKYVLRCYVKTRTIYQLHHSIIDLAFLAPCM